MAVLYQTSPKMVAIARNEEAVSAMNEEIQSRIMSQMEINKQKIDDKGSAVNAEIIDAQISDAISR